MLVGLGVIEGVKLLVGVKVGVCVIVGVSVTVGVMLGVSVTVGVTVGVGELGTQSPLKIGFSQVINGKSMLIQIHCPKFKK